MICLKPYSNVVFRVAIRLVIFIISISCISESHDTGFNKKELSIHDTHLFDLGVVDADGDGFMDIFTSNHSHVQSILLNERNENFRDVLFEWEMGQARLFRSLEDYSVDPIIDKQGLFIYWNNKYLHVVSKDMLCSGSITLYSEIKDIKSTGIEHSSTTKQYASYPLTTVNFVSNSDHGEFSLKAAPFDIALPVEISINRQVRPDLIYIGMQKINPPDTTFKLMLRDRHGIAWMDINSDGKKDAYFSRGGVHGKIQNYPFTLEDEFFISSDDIYMDAFEARGFKKRDCRARQPSWVDANGDGLLDLFITCEDTPNQFYIRKDASTFIDSSAASGLSGLESGHYLWLDIDFDNDQDIFMADKSSFILFRNNFGKFTKELAINNKSNPIKNISKFNRAGILSPSDFDNDLDVDIFVASMNGNRFFLNDKGMLNPSDPLHYGLPDKSMIAQWVDFDNDGFMELFSFPGGIYKQNAEGKFYKTGVLERESSLSVFDVRASWVDINNDGFRDLIISYNKEKESLDWNTFLFINKNVSNHWLQIKLIGDKGNAEAIGAKIIIEFDDGSRRFGYVGNAEGSLFSQGHYRIYFGLGGSRSIANLKVIWPDGTEKMLKNPEVDMLKVISK